MKALLIQPSCGLPGYEFPPASLGYLAGALRQAAVEVQILDLAPDKIESSRIPDLYRGRSFDFDMIGITSATASYGEAKQVARVVRDMSPKSLVVLGGPHVTHTPVETLQETPWADVVVRGEGEQAIVELAEAKRIGATFENIKGLSFRQNGQVVHTPNRPLELDLDVIPLPLWQLMPMDKYISPTILTSRGCTGSCIYCAARSIHSQYRVRGLDSVWKELEILDPYIRQSLTRQLVFFDNTFSASIGHATKVVSGLIERGYRERDYVLTAELRPDTVNPELLRSMKTTGFQVLHFGVETGSEAVLNDIEKRISLDQIRLAVYSAADMGFKLALSFTIGHPTDTEETVQETAELMSEFRALGAKCSPSIITPYPGTEIYAHPEVYGVTIHDRDWARYTSYRPVMSTKHLTQQRIGELFAQLIIETKSYTPVKDWRKYFEGLAGATAGTADAPAGES